MSGFLGGFGGSSGSSGSSGGASSSIWVSNSSTNGSVYANNIRYVPLRDGYSDYVEFQFLASKTGTTAVNIVYAMTSSEANYITLRLDTIIIGSDDNPTTSITTGSSFNHTTSSDVLIHELTPTQDSNLNITTTLNDIVYCKLIRSGAADTHSGDMRIIEIRIS